MMESQEGNRVIKYSYAEGTVGFEKTGFYGSLTYEQTCIFDSLRSALVDEELVEKRRGLGMFVRKGARQKLTQSEREKFLSEEWPAMVTRIHQLGLDVSKLLQSTIEKEGDS